MDGTGLCDTVSWINHSCDPNAALLKGPHESTGQVSVQALSPIGVGEEVTIAYIDVDQPVGRRAKILHTRYGFDCRCPKCAAEQGEGGVEQKESSERMQTHGQLPLKRKATQDPE